MKILLRGYYGWGNLGDDVLMIVVYNWLRKQFPQARIDIFSGFTKNNAACKPNLHDYHNYIHTLLPEKPQIVDWAHKEHYNLLVQGGGGVHFDHSHGGTTYSLLNSVIKTIGAGAVTATENLVRKAASKKLNISFDKKIGLGIGVGDFTADGKGLLAHASKIGEYNFIWVRDDLSVSWLKKLKFSGKVIRASDLAFATEAWLPKTEISNNNKSIGFVTLNKDTQSPAEYEAQCRLLSDLQKEGYSVKVYLFQEVVDKKLLPMFKQVAPVALWQPQKQSLNQYLSDLGSNSLLISGRAHGVILGACMGIPSITLETSSKLREVSAMFPETSALIPSTQDSKKVIALVNDMFCRLPEIKNKLTAEVEANRKKVMTAFAQTRDQIN